MTNFERAKKISPVLTAFATGMNLIKSTDDAVIIRKLLTALMHFCNQNSISFESVYGAACDKYEAQIRS